MAKKLTQEQISGLQKIEDRYVSRYGDQAQEKFKQKVETDYGAGSFDRLREMRNATVQQPNEMEAVQATPELNQTVQPETQSIDTEAPTQAPLEAPVTPEPITTPEPIQTPEPTQIPEQPAPEQPKIEAPKSIAEWKQQGSDLSTLEQMIETQYNTVAEQKDGKIIAKINGVDYQWNIDEAGNPIKTKVGGESTQDIYSRLLAGEELPDTGIKTTPEYANAKARYDIVSKYINMSEDQLYQAYVDGKIGSNIEKEIASNPNLAAAKQRYDDKKEVDEINKSSQTMLDAFTGKTTQTTQEDFLTKLIASLTTNVNTNGGDVAEFKDYMATNYPELSTDVKDLNAKNLQLKQLTDARDATLQEIIKNNPGLTMNRAMLIAARENKGLNEQIKTLSYEIGNLQANVNYQSEQAERGYDIALRQQERQDRLAQQQRQEQLQNVQFVYGLYKDQLALNTQPQWQKLSDTQLFNPNTGETKDVGAGETGFVGKWEKLDDNTLYNSTTGQIMDRRTGIAQDMNGNVDYSTVDFSTNPIYANTGEASFKNNNPTGITWGATSNELKALWDQAGVNYTIGTARPTAEGGNYVKFASVQDGLDAYMIALTQRGDDVEERLKAWVGVGDTQAYADDLMQKAGIPKGAKFSELSDDQLQDLMAVQLQRESPRYYEALLGQDVTQQPSQDLENLFAYADTLTASDRTKFLKDRGIEDAYINRQTDPTTQIDVSDIQDITDINFPEKTTEFKTKSFGFGTRMDQSDDIIRRMEEKYKNSWTSTELLAPRGEWTPNFLKSSDRQQYEQAQRNFVNAVLRQESGAVIADSEFDNAAKQYFPAAGDSAATIEQKRQNRQTVILNMYRSSGTDDKGRPIVDIYRKLNEGENQVLSTGGNTLDRYFEDTTVSQTGAGTITPNSFITY